LSPPASAPPPRRCPAPAVTRCSPSRPPGDPAFARGAEPILAVPGILSPFKITVKGAPKARRLLCNRRPLTVILPGKPPAAIDRMGSLGQFDLTDHHVAPSCTHRPVPPDETGFPPLSSWRSLPHR
jgi:hypothetical protein